MDGWKKIFLCDAALDWPVIPTIEWLDGGVVKMIDQTKLPTELTWLELTSYRDVARSIKVMNVRGAPAIGVAAAMGVALAALEVTSEVGSEAPGSQLVERLGPAADLIKSTRPTAVNLFWAVDRVTRVANEAAAQGKNAGEVAEALVEEAKRMAHEDVETNRRIGEHGADLIEDGDTVLTHCNAGSLATVQYGTALAPIRVAVEQGKRVSVIADETRPRLQGARLTAFELAYDGIPVKVASDNSAGLLMQLGKVDKVIVGADRVVRDSVFNKIGTLMVALAAKYFAVPFYVAAPSSTLSLGEVGDDVVIEQRSGDEVALVLGKVRVVPEGVETINYAFDRTPIDLVTGIITEDGVFSPSQLLERYPS
ncbi:MAG: S-methyl-5-thioribose-1-phosphate isomerase [Promethearchaeota archaeon]